jgi:sortase (surface protein transpeptidase)
MIIPLLVIAGLIYLIYGTYKLMIIHEYEEQEEI